MSLLDFIPNVINAITGGGGGSPKPKAQEVPWYQNPAFIGPLIQTAGSVYSARQANQTNIDLANTAYQRQARDLEKAGLNRILGYSKGSSGAGGSGSVKQEYDPNTALILATAFKTIQEGNLAQQKVQTERENTSKAFYDANLASQQLNDKVDKLKSDALSAKYGAHAAEQQKRLLQEITQLQSEIIQKLKNSPDRVDQLMYKLLGVKKLLDINFKAR